MKASVKRLLAAVLLVLSGLVWSAIMAPVAHATAPFSAPLQAATPVPDTPALTPTPAPTVIPAPNPITQIFQHVINFDATDSLLSAWTRVLERAQEKALADLEPVLEEAARQAAHGFLRFSSRGLEGLDGEEGESAFLGAVKDLWSRVFSVAVLLFPLSVLMNIAAVLVSGVTAPVARAEMLESLVRALLTLGVSAGSFLLTGTMIRIAWGAAEVVAGQPASGEAAYLEELFIRLVTGSIGATALESMLTIFITLTVIFLALMAISALILSYFAVLALTVSMVALAPLVIVVGSLPEFRWVYGAWMRAFVSVLMIPLANAILFKMWAVFALQGQNLVDILVSLGFICIIITVNFYAGRLVFAPAMEAGRLAAGSMLLLVQLAVAAAGLATGLAGLGAAAGSAGGPGMGALGGGLPGGGASGNGGAGLGAGESDRNGAFQDRVEQWKRRSPEERQAALAGIEQTSIRNKAAGQFVEGLAGRDPLLRAAAGLWSTGRYARLSNERSVIQAADSQVTREERAQRQEAGASHSYLAQQRRTASLAADPNPRAPAARDAAFADPGATGYVPATANPEPPSPGGQVQIHDQPGGLVSSSADIAPGRPSTGPGVRPMATLPVAQPASHASTNLQMPPGSSGIFPVLFGNPAYDDQGLAARGWNPQFQAHLREDVQGLYRSAQTAAQQAGLPHGDVIYDPLITRQVQAETGSNLSNRRVTPEAFQAAAVRVSASWLSQDIPHSGLPGANVLERQAAEQILRRVSADLPDEPLGRLAQSILETGQADPGNLSPAEFWDQVNTRIGRR